jgi:hypothetical protein
LYKSLSGKNSRPPPNQPIASNGKVVNKGPDIAKKFCKQFTKTVPHESNRQSRIVIRKLNAKHKLDPSFTNLATRDSINAAKSSSAVGPHHQLPNYSFQYLCQ